MTGRARIPGGSRSSGGRRRWIAELPNDPDAVRGFVESLELGEDTSQEELPARGTPAMVVRSLRLPLDLDRRVKAAAERRGVPTSTLIREWIELELAAVEDDQPISRADALRALAWVRPIGAG